MKLGNIRSKRLNNPPPVNTAKTDNRQDYWIASRFFTIILFAAMTIGICLLAYPSFADYWNSMYQAREVMSYAERVSNMDKLQYAEILDEARIYNAEL